MASLDVAAAGRGSPIARLIRWWLGELAGLVPARVRRLVGAEVDSLVVVCRAEEAVFAITRGGGTHEIGRVSLDAAPAEVARVISAAKTAFSRVVGRLPAGRALQRTVSLPAAAAGDLGRVLGYEIERQTPFRHDQVFLTHRIVGRDVEARTVDVAVTVVPREAVREIRERLTAWDLAPDAIDVVGHPAAGAGLLPGDWERTDRSMRALNGGLVVVGLALAVLAIAGPLTRDARIVGDLEREIAALRPAVERALEMEGAVREVRASAASVLREKAAAASVVAMLEALTRALPDDTWLAQFDMSGGTIEIQGASASALVETIERTPEFVAVRFRTPITREPITGLERFQFTIDLAAAGTADR